MDAICQSPKLMVFSGRCLVLCVGYTVIGQSRLGLVGVGAGALTNAPPGGATLSDSCCHGGALIGDYRTDPFG